MCRLLRQLHRTAFKMVHGDATRHHFFSFAMQSPHAVSLRAVGPVIVDVPYELGWDVLSLPSRCFHVYNFVLTDDVEYAHEFTLRDLGHVEVYVYTEVEVTDGRVSCDHARILFEQLIDQFPWSFSANNEAVGTYRIADADSATSVYNSESEGEPAWLAQRGRQSVGE